MLCACAIMRNGGGGGSGGLELTCECLFGCVYAYRGCLCGQLGLLQGRHMEKSETVAFLSVISHAGCVSGFLLSSHNPFWQHCLPCPAPCPEATEQDGVDERMRVLSAASDCSLLFHSQMVLITGPLKPVLCQLVLVAHFPPSFVWWWGCGLACPHMCMRPLMGEEIVASLQRN